MNNYDKILEEIQYRVDEGRLAKAFGTAALAGALGYGLGKADFSHRQPVNNIVPAAQQSKKVDNISQNGIDFIKGYEKLVLYPYDDSDPKTRRITEWTHGATIGYGHLIRRSEWETYKNDITKAQAEELFKNDLQEAINVVKNTIKVGLTQNQFDMLVSLAYNIGSYHFTSSSIVKLINGAPGSDYKDKKSAWNAWNKANNEISNGLIKRRAAEWERFES